MRATHWIIGCALCLAGIGSAAATSLDTQDNAPRAANDMPGAHDANGSGGDAMGLNHDTPASTSSGSAGGSTSGDSDERSGGGTLLPAQTRRSHLGWQSLLPGSIQ